MYIYVCLCVRVSCSHQTDKGQFISHLSPTAVSLKTGHTYTHHHLSFLSPGRTKNSPTNPPPVFTPLSVCSSYVSSSTLCFFPLRDFAYVARDKNTRILKCHVFRCDTPAKAIATSLHEICSRVSGSGWRSVQTQGQVRIWQVDLDEIQTRHTLDGRNVALIKQAGWER